MAQVTRQRIGGVLIGLASSSESGVLSELGKLEKKEAVHIKTLSRGKMNSIQESQEQYQRVAIVIKHNFTTTKVRPIVTLTDNIPEQGSVITIYKATSDSQTGIRDTDMAEEGIS